MSNERLCDPNNTSSTSAAQEFCITGGDYWTSNKDANNNAYYKTINVHFINGGGRTIESSTIGKINPKNLGYDQNKYLRLMCVK